MAEYCKDCAEKYGMLPDTPPLLCEGCARYIKKVSFWDKIIKKFTKQ